MAWEILGTVAVVVYLAVRIPPVLELAVWAVESLYDAGAWVARRAGGRR